MFLRSLGIALCACLSFGVDAVGATSSSTVSRALAGADGWVAYDVPMVADAGVPCCFSGRGDAEGCDLDARGWGVQVNGDRGVARTDTTLTVYLHARGGEVDDVRAYARSCPVRARGTITRLDGIEVADSLAWLEARADAGGERAQDGALPAIAWHADDAATRLLERRAEPGRSNDQREKAMFWLSQSRGAEGARIVLRHARGDADPDLREKALFPLSQSRGIDAYASLFGIAREDTSTKVRSQALFWMAQTQDTRAVADISARVRDDRDDDVREQGVFALSQLDDGRGDGALVALVRGDYPREVRRKALFWLGQSGSPLALQALDEALR